MDYSCPDSQFIPLDFSKLDVKNTYDNFISGSVIPFDYSYPEKADIYITDAGIYFPSQYERELVKKYPSMPVFQALARHIGDCRFHCNVQNLNRLWDKIREQADNYIMCNWCKVFFGKLVFMKVTVYDKYQSCVDRVKPFKPLRIPLFAKSEAKATLRQTNAMLRNQYDNGYGTVRSHFLIFVNKSKYDTRIFKSILRGENDEKIIIEN